jgi:hypothetical protein
MKVLNEMIKINNYTLKNYTALTNNEKIVALEFRNKNRRWMINNKEIFLENHLNWCDDLKENNSQIYYLVFKDDIPFMAINYHDINYDKKESHWGYFLGLDAYSSEVLKIEQIIIDFAFTQLGLDKLIVISAIDNKVNNIHKFFGFIEDGNQCVP